MIFDIIWYFEISMFQISSIDYFTILYFIYILTVVFQWDVSNSFFSPLQKNPIAADLGYLQMIFFYIENGILCVLLRITSMR